MDKHEFYKNHSKLYLGMNVYSREGEKLGKLVEGDDYSLTIEKGFFFPKNFTISYDDIEHVSKDDITINAHRNELEPWRNDKYEGWNEIERANSRQDVSMPLREEELDIEKTQKTAGNVRLRKVVHTELRNISVPVSKEEVVVERIPASDPRYKGKSSGYKDKDAFREQEINMPLREEEIDVNKRTVLKEEVRASKQRHTEHKNVNEEVRREDVEIDRDRDYKPKP